MEKKTYTKPTLEVVEQESASILAGSQTPSGYSVNYKDEDGEDGVPTIQNSIWDR